MPENSNELLWWGLNGAILIILYLVRTDLRDIKLDIKETKAIQEANKVAIAEIKARCVNWGGGGVYAHPSKRSTDELQI